MKTRSFGPRGDTVSEIGFGAWAIGGGWGPQNDRDSLDALEAALDRGVTLIDTAAGYGNGKSERLIADVLQKRRERVCVATKIPPMAGPWPPSPYCKVEDRYPEDYLRTNLEERLRNLKTECIDVLQLHTWTRAWNANPRPFEVLRKFQEEGKIRLIGVSTPETDQNSVNGLMRDGWVDVVQVIYNIFQQEPAAELLPLAEKKRVGIIVRVALDEGGLTGKYSPGHQFDSADFRSRYFAGDRLERTWERTLKIQEDLAGSGLTLVQAALKFVLAHPAVSTVIPGMRSVGQAEANAAVSDLPDLSPALIERLRKHAWHRSFWYAGK